MIDIAVKDLVKSFEIGDNLLDGLTFEVQEGQCVAILGRNGCGKTTLFRILTGEIGYDEGEVYVNPNKKLGLISQIPRYPAGYTVEEVLRSAFRKLLEVRQRMEELESQMTASTPKDILNEYDRLSNRFAAGGGYDMDVDTDKVCNGLGIPETMRQQEFDMLSGGEKTRVNLARLLLEKTEILLLDEPTNHLDLKSVEWLEAYINRFKGTVLTISHDRYFIDRFANRIWTLEGGKIQDFRGDYTAYQAYRERQKALTPPPKKEEKAKKEKPKRSGGTKQLKKELAAAEKRMEKLDQLLEALNVQKEAAASDYQKLQELLQQEAAYNAEYDALMETWETLSEAIAAEEGT